ncbi:MAG TPA: hypothetical protein PLW34_07100 [Termitinemataceae bacterium]|jgi:hypothetical protein|nr:hypothetical protein [Termitinemataceae bacterium]HOM24302.1 hypothetical protein [Termitinemataceae bacterium]HPQ00643.1 hypothetical protein [Termitinemataceae bacterium]
MARIKSALELALEKTESIKTDKTAVAGFERKREGKRLASLYLENPEEHSLEEAIKKCPKEELPALKRGIFEMLLSQIQLPENQDQLPKIERIFRGMQLILTDRRLPQLFNQVMQAFSRFLQEQQQYEEAIKRQYAPKLRQKEEELARRLGQRIRLDPFQDPEFVAFYNQNMNMLKGQYQALVDEVRQHLEQWFTEQYGAE